MQELIRKYRKTFGATILIVIGIPMLFFGVSNPFDTGPRSAAEAAIGSVGDVPLKARDLEQNLQGFRRRPGPDGEFPTNAKLKADGTLDTVLNQMIDAALVTALVEKRNMRFDKELLVSRLKEDQSFKNEAGEFDAEVWNRWVESPSVDWKSVYDSVQEQLSRQMFFNVVLAPSTRVFESEVEKELQQSINKYKVKLLMVDPPVEPTDEQMQKHFADNQEKYRKPSEYIVDYVRLSLQPEMPELALDIVKQAREGADFAALADAHTVLQEKNGGVMIPVADTPSVPAVQRPLLALQPGEISEPVRGSGGYFHIYKSDSETTNAEGIREVSGRQIMLRAELSQEEIDARKQAAKDLADKMKATGSLAAAVEEANAAGAAYEIIRSPQFAADTREIEGILLEDTALFRTRFAALTDDNKFTPIETSASAYVAELAETIQGAIPTFEEVAERVQKDTITELKALDEHKAKIKDYTARIKAEAKTLADIQTLFPELNAVIIESDEYQGKDFIVKITSRPGEPRPFIGAKQVAEALEGKEPGQIAGPVADFGGNANTFVELVSITPPAEGDGTDIETERKNIRDRQIGMAQNDYFQDFQKDLRERMINEVPISLDQKLIDRLLRLDEVETPPAAPEAPTAPEAPEAPAAE